MKKVCIRVVIVAMLSMAFVTTAAAQGTIYRDDELGFSIEIPEEYSLVSDGSNGGEYEESLNKYVEYILDTSVFRILYYQDDDALDILIKRMPDGVPHNEIDYFMFPDQEIQEVMNNQDAADTFTEQSNSMGWEARKIEANQFIEFGGKLALCNNLEAYDLQTNKQHYLNSKMFLYKNMDLTIFYYTTNQKAKEQLEAIMDTIVFDVIPSDKDARLKSTSSRQFESILILLAILSVIAFAIYRIIKLKRKGSKQDMLPR